MKPLFRPIILLLTLFALLATLPTLAQDDVDLSIGQIDLSNFPTVRFNLISADSRRVPLSINDLEGMSLREAGVPIAEYDVQTVPVGVDVIFVIDANPDIVAIDENNSRSRYEVVQETIARFAERVMSPSGLDRVTIVVADDANVNGRFLITDASDSSAITQAINNYNPPATEPVPLNEMMMMGIEHAGEIRENGRFQALLLLSDAGRINQQLDYLALVEQAQAVDLPLYGAILGAGASLDEIGNFADLYEPTRATYAHVPIAENIDPIFLIWQRQANQIQISYRSRLTVSGSYPVNLNIGTLIATTNLELNVLPPTATILTETDVVTRIGSMTDTPLAELMPTEFSLALAVAWPDGMPRQITAVNWFINAQPQPVPNELVFDPNGQLALNWDITEADTGVYEHRVQIADELGQTADSELIWVEVKVERPLPPTATPSATVTPEPVIEPEPAAPANLGNILFLLIIVAIIAFILLILRRVRQRHGTAVQPSRQAKKGKNDPIVTPDPADIQPFLEIIDAAPGQLTRIPIYGDNITLGSDEGMAQIVFKDNSVAKLHARIRKQENVYWLYDEGSTVGTSLNYEKLGLAPHQLKENDTIQLGRISLRFRLTTMSTTEDELVEEEQAEDEEDGS